MWKHYVFQMVSKWCRLIFFYSLYAINMGSVCQTGVFSMFSFHPAKVPA